MYAQRKLESMVHIVLKIQMAEPSVSTVDSVQTYALSIALLRNMNTKK